jgi:peptidoglycan hydrolase-like protein with peptidoglycan-binding domain
MSYLRKGLSGEPVKVLQGKLGVPADGEFGPGTEAALKAYQQQHGLAVDGVAGPDTFLAMGLGELVLLSVGAKGEAVKKLQTALGVTADGAFGPGTEKAVREFQGKNGLDVDGFAGPDTLAKIPAFSGQISPAQAAASQVATASAAEPGKAGAPPAPAKSVWGTIKGWF